MCFKSIFNYITLSKETNNGKLFSFHGKKLYAKCTDVYDGDTCTVKFFYRGEILKYKIRLMGLDTPELKTKNQAEKELSLKIKDIVSLIILNKIIKIECYGFDKYGRILGDIYVKGTIGEICLNKFLIENKLGIGYDGNTKKEFDIENYNSDVKEVKAPISKDYSMFDWLFK